tara:strand:- start:25913 stop:26254 length:342 start_codon:yes stop_codon:yes gene_type:complete
MTIKTENTENTETLFSKMSKKNWHWDNFVDGGREEKQAYSIIDYHADDAAGEIINGSKPELLDYVYKIVRENKDNYSYNYQAVDHLTVDEILSLLEAAVIASVHSQNWGVRNG